MSICKKCPVEKNSCLSCEYCSRFDNDPKNNPLKNPSEERNEKNKSQSFNLSKAKSWIRILSYNELRVLSSAVQVEIGKRESLLKHDEVEQHKFAARAKQRHKRLSKPKGKKIQGNSN